MRSFFALSAIIVIYTTSEESTEMPTSKFCCMYRRRCILLLTFRVEYNVLHNFSKETCFVPNGCNNFIEMIAEKFAL